MPFAYLGLGSNLNTPQEQISLAIRALKSDPDIALKGISPFYRSKPLGPQNQPDYINAAVSVYCELPPEELLHRLHRIEDAQGRERVEKWGARTLDIDLLLYDKLLLDTPFLTLPHKEMTKRAFVLKPLADIAPNLCLPDGRSIVQLLHSLPKEDVTSLASLEEQLARQKT